MITYAVCPKCGVRHFIGDGDGSMTCPYCGTTFSWKDSFGSIAKWWIGSLCLSGFILMLDPNGWLFVIPTVIFCILSFIAMIMILFDL